MRMVMSRAPSQDGIDLNHLVVMVTRTLQKVSDLTAALSNSGPSVTHSQLLDVIALRIQLMLLFIIFSFI